MNIKMFMLPLSLVLAVPASAAEIRFTAEELAAAITLLKPDATTLILDGAQGRLEPPPFIKYFGIETLEFDINMTEIANLVDLRFDRAIGRNPKARFTRGAFELDLTFDDRVGVLRSVLGRIDCRNTKLTAVLDWRTGASGARELYVSKMKFAGSLNGTGLLSPALVLNRVKKLAMRLFAQQIQRILSRPEVQQGVQTGFTQWARMATGSKDIEADVATIEFVEVDNATFLRFETRTL